MAEFKTFSEKCIACGRNQASIWCEGQFFCEECNNLFGTCGMCDHSVKCEFKDNPAPMPHFVTKRIRQETPGGYIEQIAQIPNPQRVKTFCLEGKCICLGYVDEQPKCMRQFGTCAQYMEHKF